MTTRKKVKKRTQTLKTYRKKFPDRTQKAIAKIFHISEATVSRALR